MAEFISQSGAKVIVNVASWEATMRLKNAIFSSLADSGVKVDLNLADMAKSDFDLGSLIGSVLKVESSKEFNDALWPCLAKCTRNGEKVTPQLFDDENARLDYYDLVFACLEENLRPFYKGLASRLKETGLLKILEGSPK